MHVKYVLIVVIIMSDYTFFRYKHKFAYGTDKEWTYKLVHKSNVADEELIEEICELITEEYSYSERYRGIDYDITDDIPDEELKKLATINDNKIANLTKVKVFYDECLQKIAL
jgi:hypothetical protein